MLCSPTSLRALGLLGLWTLGPLAGCTDSAKGLETGESAHTDAPNPETVPLHGACDLASNYGGFSVSSTPEASAVYGSVSDGVVPITILEETLAEGGCRLLRRNNPYCNPPCAAGETCDFDGTCVPYPVNQDLGIVDMTGLAHAVSMEPVFPGNTYFDTSLPNPPYTPGELITLQMPEGAYGPVELYGVGLEALEGTDAEWQVDAGVDLAVSWSAPDAEVVRSEIGVSINIDQHGTSPTTLICTFPDTGSASVPSTLLQALIDSGVTGFPSGSVVRRTVDSTELAGGGCFDLTVAAPLTIPVDVVGYTPCIGDPDCPDGLDCNEELQICQ